MYAYVTYFTTLALSMPAKIAPLLIRNFLDFFNTYALVFRAKALISNTEANVKSTDVFILEKMKEIKKNPKEQIRSNA